MNLDDADPKQKALLSLVLASETFFLVACQAIEREHPGRVAQNLQLLAGGQAHLAISIQRSSTELRAAIALVAPEFIAAVEPTEMTIAAPIAAAFADPDRLTIHNLAKMH